MANQQEPLDIPYSDDVFLQMLAFLKERLSNASPYASHYGGYTYLFKTSADKELFDRNIETNETYALQLPAYSFKEGAEAYLDIAITSGYSNRVMLNSTGNVIKFSVSRKEGQSVQYEPYTVNYTFTCNGITQTLQEQYSAYDNDGNPTVVELNVDSYLGEGVNTITIQARGNNSKISSQTTVTYTVSQLIGVTDLNVAELHTVGDALEFGVTATGSPDDDGNMIAQFCLDGEVLSAQELKIYSTQSGRNIPHTITGITTAGKHTLQMRIKATIGGVERYSLVQYYEIIEVGATGRMVAIKRELDSTDFLGSSASLTLKIEQYVTEQLNYGFYSSIAGDKVSLTWQLVKDGEATSIGNTKLGEDTAINDGVERTLSFMALEEGRYTLQAVCNGDVIAEYDTLVSANSSNLHETTTSMTCRLFALGRSNDEDTDVRSAWTYESIATAFSDMDWTQRNGWYNSALHLLGGKAEISVKPFEKMSNTTAGCTVEIDFMTTNVTDESAVVMSVGERIKITANTATFKTNSGTTKIFKFPTNTRLKLAFVAHPKNSASTDYPLLMEIVEDGIGARCINYSEQDSFFATDTIVIGGTDKCGINVYSLRTYTTDLTPSEELSNVIVSADDIQTMVKNNDIYTSGKIDVDKIRDRIACLAITGKGGTNVLSSIWDSYDKVQIYADAEWTNPDYPASDFVIENMRIRSHGQSTLANPMKSLKVWLKDDADNAQYTTKLTVNGVEDTSEDHRWSMKSTSHPMNKFVFQCYYIDSSNSKSPTALSLYNDISKAAGILTPPQLYARDEYPTKMGVTFPYEIRQSPDSLPCCIISRDDESSEWKFEGIFVLMDDKKSDYLYGERSIYDAPNDPFCYNTSKKTANTLWDNTNVTRFEFLSNNHPLCQMNNLAKVENFYGSPQAFDADDDVQTQPESGSASTDAATKDWEQALELIYPDPDDLTAAKLKKHTDKVYDFIHWVTECATKGDNYATFYAEAEHHMDLEKWAMYYIWNMVQGAFDSMVRNMQLTTMELQDDGTPIWFPLPWDYDIMCGTINTGPLAFDPPVDRQTETSEYGVAFRGQDCMLWNMLESWTTFMNLVSTTLDKLYKAGWSVEKIIETMQSYTNEWPEAMYNESQNTKYKQMYLGDPANKSSYLAYMLGRGTNFNTWWLKKNWDYWCANLAAGSFSSISLLWRIVGDQPNLTFKISYGEDTYFGWALDGQKQLNAEGTFSKLLTSGTVQSVTIPSLSNSWRVEAYQPAYIKTMDLSSFGFCISQLKLENCVDEITGTMLEELAIGVPDADLLNGVRNGATSIDITGLANLTSLRKLQMQGFTGLGTVNISGLSALTHLYMKGSGFTELNLPSGASLTVAELPDSLYTLSLDRTSIASLTFHPSAAPDTAYTFPHSLRIASFIGLGDSETIKTLILDWLAYCDEQGVINQTSLTIYNVSWTGLTYDDILRIGKVGSLSITGYVEMEGKFDDDQVSELLQTYDSEHYSIFSTQSAFRVGCSEQGFAIGVSGDAYKTDGKWYLLAGKTAQFTAVSFGTEASTDMMWMIVSGSISGSNSTKNGATLGIYTGTLTTIESGNADFSLTLSVTNGSISTNIDITVVKRIYPSAVMIQPIDDQGNDLSLVNGKYQITDGGYYYFRALFTVNGAIDRAFEAGKDHYGNFLAENGHQWTYSETDANRSIKCTTLEHHQALGTDEYLFCLQVLTPPTEDTDLTLGYWAEFMNNAGKITASTLGLLLFSVYRVLGNISETFGGNPNLYQVFADMGLTPSDGVYYTNVDMKSIIGTLTIPSDSGVKTFVNTVFAKSDGSSTSINVLHYLQNVTTLDCTNVSTLTGTLDISKLPTLSSLLLGGTSVSASTVSSANLFLKTYTLGKPQSLIIDSAPELQASGITVQNSSALISIQITNLKNGGAFKLVASMMPAPSLHNIKITQSGNEGVTYATLESLAYLLNYSLSGSQLNGSVSSTYAYKDTVDKLKAAFTTFAITYTYRLLRMTSNPTLKASLLSQIGASVDGLLGVDKMASATSWTVADDVTSLVDTTDSISNILALMTSLLTLKGGSILTGDVDITSNTKIESVDMSDTQTENIIGVTDKASLTEIKYHTPTAIVISNCKNLNIND